MNRKFKMKSLFPVNLLPFYLLLPYFIGGCVRDGYIKESKGELQSIDNQNLILNNDDIMELIDEELISKIQVGLNDTLVRVLYKQPFQDVVYLSIYHNDSVTNLIVKRIPIKYFNPFISTRKNQVIIKYNIEKIIINDIQWNKILKLDKFLFNVTPINEYPIDGGFVEWQIKNHTTTSMSNLMLSGSATDTVVFDGINKFILEINSL